ncbi:MAG: hypothetical protein ABIJ59_00680 [Pseudomonadota bacterium]
MKFTTIHPSYKNRSRAGRRMLYCNRPTVVCKTMFREASQKTQRDLSTPTW